MLRRDGSALTSSVNLSLEMVPTIDALHAPRLWKVDGCWLVQRINEVPESSTCQTFVTVTVCQDFTAISDSITLTLTLTYRYQEVITITTNLA
jgi:hypothetical protein